MEKEEGSSVLTAKIISGTVLFAVSTVCGLLPFKLVNILKLNQTEKDKKPHLMVDLLLFFGGGVLIATTFLHLLPDITLTINYLKGEGLIPQMGFSLPEFLMMIGFFLIYLVEEIVHNFLHRHQRKNKIANQTNASSEKDLETHDDYGHGHSHALPIPHSEDEDTLVSSLRGLLIVLALSIHELFEGFAVGLQKSSKGVYFMFAAVCAHKFVIAFCIGIELIVQKTRPMLAVSYIVIYSVVSAIGIAIGALLSTGSNGDKLQVPNAILQGLATGTLLYVIFYEILLKEKSGLIQYCSVFFGFLMMFGLQYIAGVTEKKGLAGEKLPILDDQST